MSGVPWWAFPGNKVVCVDDDENRYLVLPPEMYEQGLDGLDAGRIYTIRSVAVNAVGSTAVRLIEIIRPGNGGRLWFGAEGGYDVQRFRPLVSDDNETEATLYNKRNHNANAPRKRERA